MDRIPKLSASRLALHNELFRQALHGAEDQFSRGSPLAAKWALLAAEMADSIGCDYLMSGELEDILLKIAATIPQPKRGSAAPVRRWLHVFSHAPEIGGHSALAKRWITLDSGEDQHSLITTFQTESDIPESMAAAVLKKHGTVSSVSHIESLVERASHLRSIAWQDADVVVLHTHMWDIVPAIAFGVSGGPPVLFVNHADHTFWVGAAVSDRVINIRESGEEVTRKWRGVQRTCYLPIPLAAPDMPPQSIRHDLCLELGIPSDAKIFLTVGSSFKYTPITDISFIETVREILSQAPNTFLIAVGPSTDHPDWQQARHESKGRILAVGPKENLSPYFDAADVYLEGFPFGSLTALLEAGLAGLPCIRAPQQCPPPFTSDGQALDHLPQPSTLEDYIAKALVLISSSEERASQAAILKSKLEEVHLGSGWQNFLEQLKQDVPGDHNIYAASASPAPSLWNEYWWPFMAQRMNIQPLLFFYVRGHQLGLTPKIGIRLSLLGALSRIREQPKGPPGPISLGLFHKLIAPFAKTLPYGANSKKCLWWPWMTIAYWYGTYFGWRINS